MYHYDPSAATGWLTVGLGLSFDLRLLHLFSAAGPSQAAACWLIVAALSLTARLVDADTSCNARGDDFAQQQQWQKAVDAYRECSSSHGGKGPVAAWSMYKIYHVAYWQLKDKATAGAACEAGWEALQAPELGGPDAWVQGRRGLCAADVAGSARLRVWLVARVETEASSCSTALPGSRHSPVLARVLSPEISAEPVQ